MCLSCGYLLHCTILLLPRSFLCWNPQKSLYMHPPCKNNSSLFHTPHPATLSHSAPLSVFILASKHLLKRCIWRTKVTSLLERGFLSCTSHFHCDLCFPPTLSLFVLWKKSIKLSSIHIAANLILLLEISSAVRRHLSPLLALLEWPARLRGWGKGS